MVFNATHSTKDEKGKKQRHAAYNTYGMDQAQKRWICKRVVSVHTYSTGEQFSTLARH
jgi:hypothetical protein